jgi:TetR/AcrR family transcriptional regulator, regulator of cefoperazone and chloramphenicol sensitivity
MLMNCSTQHPRRSSRNDRTSPRQRVLKVACQVFAQRGFDGTHIREICELAGVNIAALCYYFRSKEGLYAAVQAEARQKLSGAPALPLHDHAGASAQERLQAAIESLFAKLSADSAWVAHLLACELADNTNTSRGMVGDALRPHLVLIETIIREAAGRHVDHDSLRLAAHALVSQCMFFCAASTALPRIFPQLPARALRPEALIAHISQSSVVGFHPCPSQRPDQNVARGGRLLFQNRLRRRPTAQPAKPALNRITGPAAEKSI